MDNKTKLNLLADKYENKSFLEKDPSQFLYRYSDEADIEVASFIAALFSFGSRSQFIPKISLIFEIADNWCKINNKKNSICIWLLNGNFYDFTKNADNDLNKKYYRFYSYNDVLDLFGKIKKIILQDGSLGKYFKKIYETEKHNTKESANNTQLIDMIAQEFKGNSMVPQTKASCKKRICMFLRWMVRQNSAVDLGLWNWYPQSKLIIPLDTHVMQEAEKLGLLKPNSPASMKTAIELTARLNQFFPEDPVRADYALFGLGVDSL